MAKSSKKETGKSNYKASMNAASEKLAELAQNPVARSMLAAGLVAAAAALTTNEKVRKGAQKAGREALEGAETAADNASKIGAAIVSAAADAVRKLMTTAPKASAGASAKPAAATRKAKAPAKPAAKAKGKKSAGAKKAGASKSAAPARTAAPTKSAAPAKAAASSKAATPAKARSSVRTKTSAKPKAAKASGGSKRSTKKS